jgi:hypothetical protein
MYTFKDTQSKVALRNSTGWTLLLMSHFRNEMRNRAARTQAQKEEYDPEVFSVLIAALNEEIRMYEECLACVEAGIIS